MNWKTLSPALLAACLLLVACRAEDPDSPVAKRKHAFKSMLAAKEVLFKMATKQKPFELTLAKEQVALLVSVADKPWPFFAQEFQSAGQGAATDNVWKNQARFKTKIDAFKSAVTDMKHVTDAGQDFNTFYKAYRRLENTCASCHQQFRNF